MRTNYDGPSLILGLFAERFAARGRGSIVESHLLQESGEEARIMFMVPQK
ncbi:protein of unknown function [Bradyrhizobium vignae]|uniref:Uncharacterized protein n=1 Tax=Bradyrhizobium vignae TaxID=1549949 RepID=A0A2U3Q9J2_9BRAD|nr:protein of unknown function [Bradyrhizobium vignae]